MNDRELKISEKEYERQSRQTAWIVTLVFHLCALLPMIFITCSPGSPIEEMTEIVGWGGSGGNPDVNAPVGEAPRGNPDATGAPRNTPQQQEPQTQTPSTATPVTPRNPDTKASQERPTESTNTPSTESPSSSSSSNAPQNTGNSDEGKGQPDTKGSKPAGGSGGSTVGVGDPGIGRCWQRSPSAAASGAKTTEEGTVQVAAIVKWDGTVTGIRKVSGSTSLFGKARSLLAGARACRADPSTPDVPITLRYRFELN